jgi:hypothetical protein
MEESALASLAFESSVQKCSRDEQEGVDVNSREQHSSNKRCINLSSSREGGAKQAVDEGWGGGWVIGGGGRAREAS